MIKKLILLMTLIIPLQNISANTHYIVGEISLHERIFVEVNMTHAFEKICTLVSKESMEKFNDLLKDYCYYLVNLPDFNNLFNKYKVLYKAYSNFTGKPLTLTMHFGFNEEIDFAKNFVCVDKFKKTLTKPQKKAFKGLMEDLRVLMNKISCPPQFEARTRELHNKIEIELNKCHISMNDIVRPISLF